MKGTNDAAILNVETTASKPAIHGEKRREDSR